MLKAEARVLSEGQERFIVGVSDVKCVASKEVSCIWLIITCDRTGLHCTTPHRTHAIGVGKEKQRCGEAEIEFHIESEDQNDPAYQAATHGWPGCAGPPHTDRTCYKLHVAVNANSARKQCWTPGALVLTRKCNVDAQYAMTGSQQGGNGD